MSPGVLASMWQDEEKRVKDLEQKMKTLLKEKQVGIIFYSRQLAHSPLFPHRHIYRYSVFQIKGILRTSTGKPGEVICRIAFEEEAAMICVGTRGMGRVRRTILGSVSDFLVNHAHCPVIVCRARKSGAFLSRPTRVL